MDERPHILKIHFSNESHTVFFRPSSSVECVSEPVAVLKFDQENLSTLSKNWLEACFEENI